MYESQVMTHRCPPLAPALLRCPCDAGLEKWGWLSSHVSLPHSCCLREQACPTMTPRRPCHPPHTRSAGCQRRQETERRAHALKHTVGSQTVIVSTQDILSLEFTTGKERRHLSSQHRLNQEPGKRYARIGQLEVTELTTRVSDTTHQSSFRMLL